MTINITATTPQHLVPAPSQLRLSILPLLYLSTSYRLLHNYDYQYYRYYTSAPRTGSFTNQLSILLLPRQGMGSPVKHNFCIVRCYMIIIAGRLYYVDVWLRRWHLVLAPSRLQLSILSLQCLRKGSPVE